MDAISRGLARQTQQNLASALPGMGAGLVGFRAVGAAAAPRTVEGKLRDRASIRDFGAVGDGTTDDTAAIQAAINATIGANGGLLEFPDGTYKITAKLVVPLGYGWEIRGVSRGGAQIVQFADNTPILSLEGGNSHSFVIEKLLFSWNTQQTIAQTGSIAIKLGSGVAGVSYYQWQVRDCFFRRGCRGIVSDRSNTPLLWGYVIDNCVFNAEMTGAAIMTGPAGAGQPRAVISNCLFSATNCGEDNVQVGVMDTLTMINNEWLGGGPHRLLLAQGIIQFSFIGNRSEAYNTGTTANIQMFNFAQSRVLAINTNVSNLLGSGNNTIVFHNNVGTILTILGLSVGSSKTGGSTIAYTGGTDETILQVLDYASSGAVTETNAPVVKNFADRRQSDSVTDIGDANAALTAASSRIQYQNATLTAIRTITLPGAGLYDGMEFEITRKAAVPGGFTLQVVDPIGANNHTFPSSANGFVRYRAKSGAWRILQAGSL